MKKKRPGPKDRARVLLRLFSVSVSRNAPATTVAISRRRSNLSHRQARCRHQANETYLASDCRAKCGAARIGMKSNFMNTAFLLMAQYGGKAIVPIEDVCRDYFSHLNPTKLIQKISLGDIAIPLVRMESSQKCAKGVHLLDLAKYLDARVDAARKEMVALTT